MSPGLLALTMTAALIAPPETRTGARSERARSELVVEKCLIKVLDECRISAEEAGLLLKLDIKLGDEVVKGTTPIAQISDQKAQAAKRIANAELAVAMAEAENEIEEKYATAAFKVAKTTYDKYKETNKNVPKSVAKTELLKLELEAERARLQIDQAKHKRKVDGLTTEVKSASVQAADEDIARRKVLSPLNGTVVEVIQQPGQWVNAGDPIAHVIRLDRLVVEGEVSAAQYHPRELKGHVVRIVVSVKDRDEVALAGEIVFVDPTISAKGDRRVVAHVENIQDKDGYWTLSPGETVEMTIELDKTSVTRRAGAKR